MQYLHLSLKQKNISHYVLWVHNVEKDIGEKKIRANQSISQNNNTQAIKGT